MSNQLKQSRTFIHSFIVKTRSKLV